MRTRQGWLAIVGMFAVVASASTEKLTVSPARGLVDEPFVVKVTGVPPNASVRLSAAFTDDEGRTWTAIGQYNASASGTVDSSVSPSNGGTYLGAESGGLSCSALPVAPGELEQYVAGLRDKPHGTRPALDAQDSFEVHVRAEVDGTALDPVIATRENRGTGISITDVNDGALQGLFFEPNAGARGVPVIVVGGSGGGVNRLEAGLLASRGHPALALAYFNYRGTPTQLAEIPLELFAAAVEWIRKKTGQSDIVLMGISRGSEAVLLTAAYLPDGISGVIAVSPSHLVNGTFGASADRSKPAWTLGGRGVPGAQEKVDPNAKPQSASRPAECYAPPGCSNTPRSMPMWTDPAVQEQFGIPVEKIQVPILLMAGASDDMWPSPIGATKLLERMQAHGKARLVDVHIYPGAGHLLGRPGIGNRMSHFTQHSVSKLWMSLGGDANGNCRASYAMWQDVRRFLRQFHGGFHGRPSQ